MKVATHLCLTLIVEELKFSVEQGTVVTTLNRIKHQMFVFSVLVRKIRKRHAFLRDGSKYNYQSGPNLS